MANNKITVLGAGSWGTALACHLAELGNNVYLWTKRNEHIDLLQTSRVNSRYLPGIVLPEQVQVTGDMQEALADSGTVVFSVPSHSFREVLELALPGIPAGTPVVNTAKGIEEDTLLRMSEIFGQLAGADRAGDYVILSGPSHAEEVAQKMPTTVVVASHSLQTAQSTQDLFMGENFRVYTNPDVIGVEMGGALKNIIALGTGIIDGLNGSDNAKAGLMTRGLAEITRLGITMHANPLTFAGLAGVGDLIVTCTSMHSRNRRAGIEIGRGKKLNEALEDVHMVVEGVRTTRAAHALSIKWNVEMPITDQMYQVLFENLHPARALKNLMTRIKTHEMEEVAMAKIKW